MLQLCTCQLQKRIMKHNTVSIKIQWLRDYWEKILYSTGMIGQWLDLWSRALMYLVSQYNISIESIIYLSMSKLRESEPLFFISHSTEIWSYNVRKKEIYKL